MVWFSCLLLVFLSTVLLHLTISSGSDENRSINHQKRITDSVLSMVACVCQMDSSVRSSVTSSRIIMVSYSEFFIPSRLQHFFFLFFYLTTIVDITKQFFIFLTFSFLYSCYTANIVSLLQSPSHNIKSLEQLYNSKLKLGIDETPYMR